MPRTKSISVSEEDRAKLLLWCARHCCFCGKSCTTNMELHHIDANHSNNDLDNLIPVCFDCHGELSRYNPKHPKGIKYRYLEIKKRRDQVYDQHTLPYTRQVNIQISNKLYGTDALRTFGDISCTVRTFSNDLPVKLRVRIGPFYDNQELPVDLGEIYSGRALWNLNPTQIVMGHFLLPIELLPKNWTGGISGF